MKKSAALVCVALAATACKKPEPEAAAKPAATQSSPIAVTLASVEVQKMPRLLTLTGSVVAHQQSEVAANVPGRVMATTIERGQKVAKGQVLAQIDTGSTAFSAQASAAQAKLADTQAVQAQSDCTRADALFAQGVIAKAEYDRQKTQCQVQELQARAASANAGMASRMLSDATVRAPFAGAIGERYVNVGEYVNPGTRIASVYVFDPVRVTISVPESAVALVREGQTLDVRVAAWPDRAFPAKVEYLSPALRQNTRDLIVEATAANADAALRPGMFATVQLVLGEDEVPTVPVEALVTEGTVSRVYLARDNKAFELVVHTGVKKDGRIAVLDQFEPGAKVITKPPVGLKDGQSITEAASAPAVAAPAVPPPAAVAPAANVVAH
jgi:membrane fusion protein (multidrug efflux system)